MAEQWVLSLSYTLDSLDSQKQRYIFCSFAFDFASSVEIIQKWQWQQQHHFDVVFCCSPSTGSRLEYAQVR